MNQLIKILNDASFEADVLQSETPTLVDFWAEWCAPCKAVAPILDEIANDYQGKVIVGKLNVDENKEVPVKYGIRGIPTLLLFKDGELVATKVGALSKAELSNFLDASL